MELIWPYVKNNSDLSVEGYLAWAKEQQESLYQIKYEQVNIKTFFIFTNINFILLFIVIDFRLSSSNN